MTLVVNNPLPMQDMQEMYIQSLDQEDPLAWEWQTTLVFLSGISHGQRSLAGYRPWDFKESDITEHTYAELESG